MEPGEMIVAIVFIVCVFRFLKFAVERGTAHKTSLHSQVFSGDLNLAQRLEKIEKRMANIETIVLEREKKSEFERSL